MISIIIMGDANRSFLQELLKQGKFYKIHEEMSWK